MQSSAVPNILAQTPPAMMASLSFMLGSLRWPPWPSSGRRGSACAAGTERFCGGAKLHVQASQLH
eukprot:1155161-Alexandrium_andersonii.AAC.1